MKNYPNKTKVTEKSFKGMRSKSSLCAGYVEFVLFDNFHKQILMLGGTQFDSVEEMGKAWKAMEIFSGSTEFSADFRDANGELVATVPISAETIVKILGVTIDTLIATARKIAVMKKH
ncbi:hypothetical protein [Vibrio sp.]|uniref:hypothetical protein n=1 Tax=Vibrio sp. TaxID=678 RepID=UPI003D0DDE76